MALIEGLNWLPFTIDTLKMISHKKTRGSTDRELLEGYPYLRFNRDVPIAHMIDDEIRHCNIRVAEEMQIDTFAAFINLYNTFATLTCIQEQAIDKPFPENVRTVPFGNPPLLSSGLQLYLKCRRKNIVKTYMQNIIVVE